MGALHEQYTLHFYIQVRHVVLIDPSVHIALWGLRSLTTKMAQFKLESTKAILQQDHRYLEPL